MTAILDAEGNATTRVAIVTPCMDLVHAGFALDLVRMTTQTVLSLPGLDLSVMQNRGTIIPQQRHVLVLQAKEANATHVLWIDSDMRFPPDALIRLLAHDQPIVGCNYATRRLPILPTSERITEGFLFTDDEAEGLVEVDRCGMGLMLVSMAVYDKIPKPWFAIGYAPKDADYSGEDFYFCQKARASGFPILIDQGLSRSVRHVGAFEYENRHACLTREADHGA